MSNLDSGKSLLVTVETMNLKIQEKVAEAVAYRDQVIEQRNEMLSREFKRTQDLEKALAAKDAEAEEYKFLVEKLKSALVAANNNTKRRGEELKALREAVSPGRQSTPEYYIGVARRMREKQLVIKPLDD